MKLTTYQIPVTYLTNVFWGKPNYGCDSVHIGYQCEPETSHFWGQYSPYYAVPSNISTELPEDCSISFAQILSRHGARDPTAARTVEYRDTIDYIQSNVDSKHYKGKFKFLKTYHYSLGADQLNDFGRQQMINSGKKYYERYQALAKDMVPFLRTAGQQRVLESAQSFTRGFHAARAKDLEANSSGPYPYPIVVIPEGPNSNNTLDHSLCTSFERGAYSNISDTARFTWAALFTPPILTRLNQQLHGAHLKTHHVIHLMDLCPFETVSDPQGALSPFCALFTPDEWRAYEYYQTLHSYYGFSWGNGLGPTQGVGFANELLARLTHSPVVDHTSTNSTLDADSATFPLGPDVKLYADFSHDNDLTAIFAVLGLYNATATRPLNMTMLQDTNETHGYSASWSVPFASRAYFEKMTCTGYDEELVRVIVNDRVLPLETCGGDELGRCTLSKFVGSLTFAKGGGRWDECFND